MAQLPINFAEAFNLVNPPMSIPGECVKFGSCSLESDKFITVCETVAGAQQIAIVDMTAGNSISRQKISAEAAIMNPLSKVIALKAAQQLQIFNLELRVKMKSYVMPNPVTYWRWISPNAIALVTAASVFHWSIEGDAAPVKIFDRNLEKLGDTSQIINYQVSVDGKWCLLCGISAGAVQGTIDGNMQLYSIEKNLTQMLGGHSGAFTVIKVPGREDPAQILCFEDKKPDAAPMLRVMEIGRPQELGAPFRVAPVAFPVPPDAANDFPVTMNVSRKHDILYIISKMGYLYLFDVFSGKVIFRYRVTQDTVFAATEHIASGGIMGITRRGQVLQVTVNENNLVPYIVGTLNDRQLAIEIASRLNLSGADDLYAAQFNNLIAAGDIQGAARAAADAPRGLLRTPQTIARFQQMPAQPGSSPPVFQYFSVLLEKGKLNHLESI